MSQTIYMHLVSDSTGETLYSIARAIKGKFASLDIEQYSWPLTCTKHQTEDVLKIIKSKPGIVLCTIVDENIQSMIQKTCKSLKLPCIPVLNKIIHEVSSYIDLLDGHEERSALPVDRRVFGRAEAIEFTIAHDDGQSVATLPEADIIILGVSRTAKTPTSVYLAYRGYKVANIPYISGAPMPDILMHCTSSLIVGLTVSADRLLMLRQNRAIEAKLNYGNEYTLLSSIEAELRGAKTLFRTNNWPVIDASKKSVEEIAATVIKYHNRSTLDND